MSIKPLSEPGVPFTASITVDHSVTSLFVLPEGSFYTVESLVLDPVTGVPLRPLIDYMYFQQNVDISHVTAKQTASIIQIRNPAITSVVVKGNYSHGVTQAQIDEWKLFTILYKNVPKWMNWISCLDDVLQVHPNVKRTVTSPSMDKRTLGDVEVEVNYIADQFENGDRLYLPHIQYWQNQLLLIPQTKYEQYMSDLNTYVNKMVQDTGAKFGDFKFTDGDGMKWSNGLRNEYFGTTLKDRGTQPLGSYSYLPKGSRIPSRLTRLFNYVNPVQTVQGLITTDKKSYYYTDTMGITVQITQLNNRVLPDAEVQVIDPTTETIVASFPLPNIRVGTFNFSFSLNNVETSLFSKKLIVRVLQYMWLNPAIIDLLPTADPTDGYIDAELLGISNVGSIEAGGFVNKIKVKFKRVGILKNPQTLYVHLSGDYPISFLHPNYRDLQTFHFPIDFNESEEIVAEFMVDEMWMKHYKVIVSVSKSSNPQDNLAIIAQNLWYITAVPMYPYIQWHFAIKNGFMYDRIDSIEEGNTVYAVGKLSVDYDLMYEFPQLSVVSKGVGSAREGIDFIIDRSNHIKIDEETIAWKIDLPFKPEEEIKYKFLNVKTTSSNTAELWITDKTGPTAISGSWHPSEFLASPIIDWTSEKSTFYLHLKVPGLVDGTILNVSLDSPEMYRNHCTLPSTVTVFGGFALVKVILDAPYVVNPTQFLKLLITGPSINYTTLGIMVLDTAKPYYEIRYIVNELVDGLTAYPGDKIRCQMRCIKDPSASSRAAVMVSGSAVTDDFVLPVGTTSILKVTSVDATDWIDVFVDNLTTKEPMRLDHLTLTTNVIWPVNTNSEKNGLDTNATLNLRSS